MVFIESKVMEQYICCWAWTVGLDPEAIKQLKEYYNI
jgi:hypothetical protein